MLFNPENGINRLFLIHPLINLAKQMVENCLVNQLLHVARFVLTHKPTFFYCYICFYLLLQFLIVDFS